MKWLLLVRPEAEHDLAAARDWYDGVQTGLGNAFLDEIAATFHPLTHHPEVPRLYYGASEKLPTNAEHILQQGVVV